MRPRAEIYFSNTLGCSDVLTVGPRQVALSTLFDMSVAPPGSPHPLPIRPSIFQQGCHPHALIIDGGNAVSIGVVALVSRVLLGYKFFVAILVLRPSMRPGCAREHREPQCCALNTFTA